MLANAPARSLRSVPADVTASHGERQWTADKEWLVAFNTAVAAEMQGACHAEDHDASTRAISRQRN